MSPAPVATSVASTGARPPQTKVNLLKIFPSKYSPKKFGSKYFPQLAIFSTQHKYTSYQLGVSDACEDLSWLNWCKTSSDKGYFSSKCFSLLAIFLKTTQFYESSIRCLRPPVATSVASIGATPPQTKVNLLQIFPSKYSPKIFGSKYYPLLAIFSTKHKYTSYQLGVSDACEDFRWLNWCKTSWDKGYFSSECFSFLAIFLNNTQIYESSIRCLRRL